MTVLNNFDAKILGEVSMAGRFGKYGDTKRKARLRKNRLRPPLSRQPGKDKPLKKTDRRKRQRDIHRGGP